MIKGKMLDSKYCLERKIMKRENSTCYLTKKEDIFCLKVVCISNDIKKKETEKEIEILTFLKNHPKIILFHNYFSIQSNYCALVFEFVEMNLSTFVNSSKQSWLSEENSKKFFEQILNAVNFCHFNMITHQDLVKKKKFKL